eukprot:TRINITY_DN4488_c0_g1_i1.p1 TRINITY_DN4488_c0_g1~~TRINITY_DN4488_c0_g1_i1.p1  ORF type:complete len:3564 (+),score=702.18 TRINITY_DN4488_c0_g1_i1:52-10743(+)
MSPEIERLVRMLREAFDTRDAVLELGDYADRISHYALEQIPIHLQGHALDWLTHESIGTLTLVEQCIGGSLADAEFRLKLAQDLTAVHALIVQRYEHLSPTHLLKILATARHVLSLSKSSALRQSAIECILESSKRISDWQISPEIEGEITKIFQLLDYLIFSSSTGSRVLGGSIHAMGAIMKYQKFDDQVKRQIYWKNIWLSILERQLAGHSKIDLSLFEGGLNGLRLVWGDWSGPVIQDADTKVVYEWCKRIITSTQKIHRYGALKAALKLIERAAADMILLIASDFPSICDGIFQLCKHQNNQLRKTAARCWHRFVHQVIRHLSSESDEGKSKQIVVHLASILHQMQDIQQNPYVLQACLSTLSNLSSFLHDIGADIEALIDQVFILSGHHLIDPLAQTMGEDELDYTPILLPSFLGCFSSILSSHPEFLDRKSEEIKRVVVLVFHIYPKLFPKQYPDYHESLSNLLRTLQKHPVVFKGLCSEIVTAAIAFTCAPELPYDNLSQIQSSWRHFLPIWMALLEKVVHRDPMIAFSTHLAEAITRILLATCHDSPTSQEQTLLSNLVQCSIFIKGYINDRLDDGVRLLILEQLIGASRQSPDSPEIIQVISIFAPSSPTLSTSSIQLPTFFKQYTQDLLQSVRVEKGQLLEATLGFLLTQVDTLIPIEDASALLRRGFECGQQNLALMNQTLDVLIKLSVDSQALEPHLAEILPPLKEFLTYHQNTKNEPRELPRHFAQDPHSALVRKIFEQEKQLINPQSVAARILQLLGKLGGLAHKVLDGEQDFSEKQVIWHKRNEFIMPISYSQTLEHQSLSAFMNDLLPLQIEVAISCRDLSSRAAAAELLCMNTLMYLSNLRHKPSSYEAKIFASYVETVLPALVELSADKNASIADYTKVVLQDIIPEIVKLVDEGKGLSDSTITGFMNGLFSHLGNPFNGRARDAAVSFIHRLFDLACQLFSNQPPEGRGLLRKLILRPTLIRIYNQANSTNPDERLGGVLCMESFLKSLATYPAVGYECLLEFIHNAVSCYQTSCTQNSIPDCLRICEKVVEEAIAMAIDANPLRGEASQTYRYSPKSIHELMKGLWKGISSKDDQYRSLIFRTLSKIFLANREKMHPYDWVLANIGSDFLGPVAGTLSSWKSSPSSDATHHDSFFDDYSHFTLALEWAIEVGIMNPETDLEKHGVDYASHLEAFLSAFSSSQTALEQRASSTTALKAFASTTRIADQLLKRRHLGLLRRYFSDQASWKCACSILVSSFLAPSSFYSVPYKSLPATHIKHAAVDFISLMIQVLDVVDKQKLLSFLSSCLGPQFQSLQIPHEPSQESWQALETIEELCRMDASTSLFFFEKLPLEKWIAFASCSTQVLTTHFVRRLFTITTRKVKNLKLDFIFKDLSSNVGISPDDAAMVILPELAEYAFRKPTEFFEEAADLPASVALMVCSAATALATQRQGSEADFVVQLVGFLSFMDGKPEYTQTLAVRKAMILDMVQRAFRSNADLASSIFLNEHFVSFLAGCLAKNQGTHLRLKSLDFVPYYLAFVDDLDSISEYREALDALVMEQYFLQTPVDAQQIALSEERQILRKLLNILFKVDGPKWFQIILPLFIQDNHPFYESIVQFLDHYCGTLADDQKRDILQYLFSTIFPATGAFDAEKGERAPFQFSGKQCHLLYSGLCVPLMKSMNLVSAYLTLEKFGRECHRLMKASVLSIAFDAARDELFKAKSLAFRVFESLYDVIKDAEMREKLCSYIVLSSTDAGKRLNRDVLASCIEVFDSKYSIPEGYADQVDPPSESTLFDLRQSAECCMISMLTATQRNESLFLQPFTRKRPIWMNIVHSKEFETLSIEMEGRPVVANILDTPACFSWLSSSQLGKEIHVCQFFGLSLLANRAQIDSSTNRFVSGLDQRAQEIAHHQATKKLCQLLSFLATEFSNTGSSSRWVEEVANLITNPAVSDSFKIVMTQAVIECGELIQPCASALIQPLVLFITTRDPDSGVHNMYRDFVIQATRWFSDINQIPHHEKAAVSSALEMLSSHFAKSCPHRRMPILKSNLYLLRYMLDCWGESIQINKDAVLYLMDMNVDLAKGSGDSRLQRHRLVSLFTMLSYISDGNLLEILKDLSAKDSIRVKKSVLESLNSGHVEVRLVSAQVASRFIQLDVGIYSGSVEAKVTDWVTSSLQKKSYHVVIPALAVVAEKLPEFASHFALPILAALSDIDDDLRGSFIAYFSTLIQNACFEFSELLSHIGVLASTANQTLRSSILEFLQSYAAQIDFKQASTVMDFLDKQYLDSCNQKNKLLVYDILCTIRSRFETNKELQAIDNVLLSGLDNSSHSLRRAIVRYWTHRLSPFNDLSSRSQHIFQLLQEGVCDSWLKLFCFMMIDHAAKKLEETQCDMDETQDLASSSASYASLRASVRSISSSSQESLLPNASAFQSYLMNEDGIAPSKVLERAAKSFTGQNPFLGFFQKLPPLRIDNSREKANGTPENQSSWIQIRFLKPSKALSAQQAIRQHRKNRLQEENTTSSQDDDLLEEPDFMQDVESEPTSLLESSMQLSEESERYISRLKVICIKNSKFAHRLATPLLLSIFKKAQDFRESLGSYVQFYMSSGIESQSLAYFVLELAIKFQLYIPTKDITRVAIATQNYHIGVLALENVLSNAKKQAFEVKEGEKKRKIAINADGDIAAAWENLARLYQILGEEDCMFGILGQMTQDVEVRSALHEEASGDYLTAYSKFSQLHQSPHFQSATDSTKKVIIDGYLRNAANCLQWKTVLEVLEPEYQSGNLALSEKTEHMDFYLQAIKNTRNSYDDFPILARLRETLNTWTTTPNAFIGCLDEYYSVYASIAEDDYTDAVANIQSAYTSLAEKWKSSDPLSFNVKRSIVSQLQKLVEAEELCQLMKSDTSEDFLDRLQITTQNWDARYPSNCDKITHWDDVVVARTLFVNLVKEHGALSQDASAALTGFLARSIVKLGETATFQRNVEASRRYLRYPASMGILDQSTRQSYGKECAKALLKFCQMITVHENSDILLHTMKTLRKTSSITDMETTAKTELMWAKHEMLSLVAANFDQMSSKFMDTDFLVELGKWGVDLTSSISEQSLLDSISSISTGLLEEALGHIESDTYNQKISEIELQIASQLMSSGGNPTTVIVHSLRALRTDNYSATLFIPRILEFYTKVPQMSLDMALIRQELKQVPVWKFIKWSSNICALLDKDEAGFLADIIESVHEAYPQSIYYPLSLFVERTSEGAHSSGWSRATRLLSSKKYTMMSKFTQSLRNLTQPEHRALGYIERMEEVGSNPTSLTRIYGQLFDDVLDSNDGEENKAYAKKYRPLVESAFGHSVGPQSAADISRLREILKTVADRTVQRQLLSNFSNWLESYDASNYPKDEVIYIPGQFDCSQKPDEDHLLKIVNFDKSVLVLDSLRKPKRLMINATDENRYPYLIKGGEDVRLDQRIQTTFMVMNDLLAKHHGSSRRNLMIRTYKVIPMTIDLGFIEWIQQSQTLKTIIEHEASKRANKEMRILHGPAVKRLRTYLDQIAPKLPSNLIKFFLSHPRQGNRLPILFASFE